MVGEMKYRRITAELEFLAGNDGAHDHLHLDSFLSFSPSSIHQSGQLFKSSQPCTLEIRDWEMHKPLSLFDPSRANDLV